MKKFSPTSKNSRIVSVRAIVLVVSLVVIVLVACSSSDESDPTATSQPQATQAPVATTTPDPTATPEPPTGGDTPLAPTATVVPAEVPTKAPDPTAIPPTVAPTVAPDPFVTLLLLASGDVDPNRYPTVAPGDGELLERLFADAPPYAPHKVSDIRITVDKNQCVTCHAYALSSGGSIATEIPLSHYTDQLTGEVSEELDPRRYICTSCHVPQVTDPLPYAE